MKRHLISCVLGFILLSVAAFPLWAQEGAPTTLIMVRHAEEDRSKGEIPLNDAGRRRAVELARVLSQVKIDAVFSTATLRARTTAGPTAEEKGLKIQIYDYKDYSELPAIVDGILEKYKGKTVLVAGHTDDVPLMVNIMRKEFTPGKAVPIMGKGMYDNLFVVVVPEKGDPKFLELKYGEPSPVK
jgi:2,3-bisphosphoglycerate-dependent phosphoglycerate mutase